MEIQKNIVLISKYMIVCFTSSHCRLYLFQQYALDICGGNQPIDIECRQMELVSQQLAIVQCLPNSSVFCHNINNSGHAEQICTNHEVRFKCLSIKRKYLRFIIYKTFHGIGIIFD